MTEPTAAKPAIKQADPSTFKQRRKWPYVAILTAGLLLGILYLAVSLLAGPQIIRHLQKMARDTFEADLQIDSINVSLLRGRASLSGLRLTRKDETSSAQVTLESACVDIDLPALLRRKVTVDRLELVRPQIIMTATKDPFPEDTSTLARLARMMKRRAARQKAKPVDFSVGEIVIRDGSLDYTVTRPNSLPFQAVADGIQYSARNISLGSLNQLMWKGALDCGVRMGSVARLTKPAGGPAPLALAAMDLGYVSRLFNPAEALKVEHGRMDVRCQRKADGGLSANVELSGLVLDVNRKSRSTTFMFVPVREIVEHARSKNGRLSLWYELSPQIGASDDLDELINAVWEGMWIEILKEVAPKAMKDWASFGS